MSMSPAASSTAAAPAERPAYVVMIAVAARDPMAASAYTSARGASATGTQRAMERCRLPTSDDHLTRIALGGQGVPRRFASAPA